MENRIKPNNKLYLIMIIFFSIILIASTCIYVFVSSIYREAIYSAVVGISSGGVASVLVAWLVDASNSSSRNKIVHEIRQNVFGSFNLKLCFLLTMFQRWDKKYDNFGENISKKWDEWAIIFFEDEVWKNFSEDEFEGIIDQISLVKDEFQNISDNSTLLQSDGIISRIENLELQELITSLGILGTFWKSYQKYDSKTFVELISEIKDNIENIGFLKNINTIENNEVGFYLEFALGKSEYNKLLVQRQNRNISKNDMIENWWFLRNTCIRFTFFKFLNI